MEKEKWISSIMESASEIREAEPNPYLYNKIMSKMTQPSPALYSIKYKLSWAFAIVLVLAMNISAYAIYKTKIGKQHESTAIESLTDEMTAGTSYNY